MLIYRVSVVDSHSRSKAHTISTFLRRCYSQLVHVETEDTRDAHEGKSYRLAVDCRNLTLYVYLSSICVERRCRGDQRVKQYEDIEGKQEIRTEQSRRPGAWSVQIPARPSLPFRLKLSLHP